MHPLLFLRGKLPEPDSLNPPLCIAALRNELTCKTKKAGGTSVPPASFFQVLFSGCVQGQASK